jgi:hypothetical protein
LRVTADITTVVSLVFGDKAIVVGVE